MPACLASRRAPLPSRCGRRGPPTTIDGLDSDPRLVRAPMGSPCHHPRTPQGANGSGGIDCPSAPSDHPSASDAATTTPLEYGPICRQDRFGRGHRGADPAGTRHLAHPPWPSPAASPSSPHRHHAVGIAAHIVCTPELERLGAKAPHAPNSSRLMPATQPHGPFGLPVPPPFTDASWRESSRALWPAAVPPLRGHGRRSYRLVSLGGKLMPMPACLPPPSGPPRPRRLARGGQSRSR